MNTIRQAPRQPGRSGDLAEDPNRKEPRCVMAGRRVWLLTRPSHLAGAHALWLWAYGGPVLEKCVKKGLGVELFRLGCPMR
jgi:hypothetical protein